MRLHHTFISLLAALLWSVPPLYAASTPAGSSVSLLFGRVESRASVSADWKPIKLHDRIEKNTELRLPARGKGKLELLLDDGSKVRLHAPAALTLLDLDRQSEHGIRLKLLFGRIWSKVAKIRGNRNFKVVTATAVMGVRGTAYDTHLLKQRDVVVQVFEGSVTVSGNKKRERNNANAIDFGSLATHEIAAPKEISLHQWLVVVESMQKLLIHADGSHAQVAAIDLQAAQKDDWLAWNLARDKM